jgi:hypothetical protein
MPTEFPQLPAQETSAELTGSLQPDSIHDHARYLRIIVRHLPMRRKQFQLLRFALLVEHLHAFQPPCLRRSVQQYSGILVILGSLIEVLRLFWTRPIAFVLFLGAGGLLLGLGIFLCLFSLVSGNQPNR